MRIQNKVIMVIGAGSGLGLGRVLVLNLLENFNKETFHAQKVNEAALKYPIDIYFHKNKWIILDGVHRFTKAIRLGHKTIKVRRISEEIAQMTKRK